MSPVATATADATGGITDTPPITEPNEWIPKAPPLVGVQGAKGGEDSEPKRSPCNEPRYSESYWPHCRDATR